MEFARILGDIGIPFEYEKFHKETHTLPDFYIPEIDRYIEIHPDCWGEKKNLPENSVLIKKPSHVRATAMAMALKLRPRFDHLKYIKEILYTESVIK